MQNRENERHVNISYIMPTYNQGPYIAYAIESVLANMNEADELLIMDAASSDNTHEVVKPYLNDQRIIFKSEPDRGFSDAVTKALRIARNTIIGIMSSDDAYVSGIRQQIDNAFSDPSVVLLYGDYEVIDTKNNRLFDRRLRSGSLSDFLSLRILLPQSSTFFRRSALEGLEILDLAHDYIADVVLFNQIARRGNVVKIPVVLSQVRVNPQSRTGKKNPGVQYLKAIDKMTEGLPENQRKRCEAGGYLLQARYEASSKQRGPAASSLFQSFVKDPTLFSHWLFPRTFLYLIFGPDNVDRIKRLCIG